MSTIATQLKTTTLEVAEMDARISERVAESISLNVTELNLAEIEAKRLLGPSAHNPVSDSTAFRPRAEALGTVAKKKFQQMAVRKSANMQASIED